MRSALLLLQLVFTEAAVDAFIGRGAMFLLLSTVLRLVGSCTVLAGRTCIVLFAFAVNTTTHMTKTLTIETLNDVVSVFHSVLS